MFEKLKNLLRAKISITIVYPGAIVDVVEPKTIETGPVVKYVEHSNIRFVSETRIENDGKKSAYYSTEIYQNGRWCYADNSLSSDKDKAMELHLKIAKGMPLRPDKVREILWQGLPLEETATWVALQSNLTE